MVVMAHQMSIDTVPFLLTREMYCILL